MHLTQSLFRCYPALGVWTVGTALLFSSLAAARVQGQAAAQAETDPIVLSVQASQPDTPNELARAIRLMLDISRDDLAIRYIDQLTRLNLDDQQSYMLLRGAGSELVYRLALHAGVQPSGRQLADQIIDKASRFAHDPARLEQLTQQVADQDISKRTAALEDLQALGDVGAAALLNALADPERAADGGLLSAALRRCGTATEGPIRGALQSTNVSLRRAGIEGAKFLISDEVNNALLRSAFDPKLGAEINEAARQALAATMGTVPTVGQAGSILRQVVDNLLLKPSSSSEGLTSDPRIWRTSPQTGKLAELQRPEPVLRRLRAAERAEDLIHIQPEAPDAQRLYALALLEAAKYARGFEIDAGTAPPFEFARQAGPEFIEQVLVEALRKNLVGAAAGACEILGQIGDATLLAGTKARPLVQAASHADRRVQYAACQAILAIDPKTTFPGCSDVAAAIVSLAQSRGQSKVLVGHPNILEAQNLAAAIKLLGFEADALSNANDFLQRATTDPDVEYLLLADSLGAPTSQDLIYHLRTHPRTRAVPVGLQYRTTPIEIQWLAGETRRAVDLFLVVDTRRFDNYEDWLRRTRERAGLTIPVLLLVAKGKTDIAFGWASRDPNVRYLEMESGDPAIWKGLPDQVAVSFHLKRSPVLLVLEPRSVPNEAADVTASLVLNPMQWPRWPDWTRQLHTHLMTNRIAVVRATETGLESQTAPAVAVEAHDQRNIIEIDDLDFLYSRVRELLSNQDELAASFEDPSFEKRARRLERDDPRIVAMPWTSDRNLVARQMARLTQMTDASTATGSQRTVYARQAAAWLAQLSGDPQAYGFWDFHRHDASISAIAQTPAVDANICRALGNLGTPLAQKQLCDLASTPTAPAAIRQAAVEGLRQAVAQRGIMLTTADIQLQYDRYNASENLGEETQQILGAVLDILEGSRAARN